MTTTWSPVPLPIRTAGILPTDTDALIREHLFPDLWPWTDQAVVRVTRLPDPELLRPVIAQVTVDRPLGRTRVQVAARTLLKAVDLLETRLAARLRAGRTSAGANLEATVPLAAWSPESRPPGSRRLIRTKVCGLTTSSVRAATGVLEDCDYEVHLFREQTTGQEAVVRRTGRGSYEVVLLRTTGRMVPPTERVAIAAHVPAWRTPAEAQALLELTGRSFEFFADRRSGRGHLLYRRYDGHFALLRPKAPLRRV